MNQRIQELADQAEDYADSIVDQGGEFHPAYTRKFAELIVRECYNVAETHDCNLSGNGGEILKHFGVR